ncbi:hypothetical protein [Streptomyces sp. NPDC004008]
MSYGMGYYDGNEYEADEYEEFEEQPQQRQPAPRSPQLRQYVKQMASENKALKKQLDEQKAMLQELMDDNSSTSGFQQQGGYANPRSPRLTPEEQMQVQRMQEMGVVGVAPPMGTEREQAARIQNAKSPEELMEYLRTQGNANGTGNYQGMGY